jgi:hypothetical protein
LTFSFEFQGTPVTCTWQANTRIQYDAEGQNTTFNTFHGMTADSDSLCTDSDVILQSNLAFSYTRDENPFFGQTGADRSPTVGFFTQFGGAALTDAVGSHTLQHRCDDPDSGAVNCTHHLTTQPK